MAYPLQQYYSRIYRSYDLVNRLFTFGLDRKWRANTVNVCLNAHPSKVLDLCCGTGDIAIAVKKNSPHTHVTGYDLNAEMLDMAMNKAVKEQANVHFLRGDAGNMPFSDCEFDCITIGFGFRNLTWKNPSRDIFIREMSRVLKPGGRLLILESARPQNIIINLFYSLYLKIILVPLGGLLSGDWNAYRYLAGSSAGFYSFNELKALLNQFGLSLSLKRRFLFGSANLLEAVK